MAGRSVEDLTSKARRPGGDACVGSGFVAWLRGAEVTRNNVVGPATSAKHRLPRRMHQ